MGRYLVCAECAALLCAAGGTLQGPQRPDAPPTERVEITLSACELHPKGIPCMASEVVTLSGPLPAPFSLPQSPSPPNSPPSVQDFRAPPIESGKAKPLGPVTEIAARLIVAWMRDEPFEAQREGASDAVMVSRAASVARMLLAETRNR